MVRVDRRGVVESLSLCPEGPEEIGGMIFRRGVMVCGLPEGFTATSFDGRDDFAARMARFRVMPGAGPVSVLSCADLSTLRGGFSLWLPDYYTANR